MHEESRSGAASIVQESPRGYHVDQEGLGVVLASVCEQDGGEVNDSLHMPRESAQVQGLSQVLPHDPDVRSFCPEWLAQEREDLVLLTQSSEQMTADETVGSGDEYSQSVHPPTKSAWLARCR
jgi:hypothetical protein